MPPFVIEAGALTLLMGVLSGLLAWARRRFPPRTDPVVEAINALLPQTQCAQCGYPGCRPYAEAVASGAPVDLCPPGGAETQMKLASLLGREPGSLLPPPHPAVARIDETRCIGCFLCVEACPVDAIVGAPRLLHTVIADRCTGCELCLPPCPVDCIDLLPLPVRPAVETPADAGACIRCNRCEPVCPEGLPVARLWWLSRGRDLDEAVDAGLSSCIECGLCNPACPSGIDLVGTFHAARQRLEQESAVRHAADVARRHADERQNRLASKHNAAADRRAARLAALNAPRGRPRDTTDD